MSRVTKAVVLLVVAAVLLAPVAVVGLSSIGGPVYGSPARSDFGDRGFASVHHLRECDWSPNGRNASGVGYNRGSTDAAHVEDKNGVGPGCGNKDVRRFKIKMHQSCGWWLGACGRIHIH